ncbi:MAG: hypothetical protein ACO1RX_08295 [Candidatus Sericytochromatia bacterium]
MGLTEVCSQYDHTFPYPLASHLRKLRTISSEDDQQNELGRLHETIVRFLSILVLAEYQRLPTHFKEPNEYFLRNLNNQMTSGKYLELIRSVLKELSQQREQVLLPELLDVLSTQGVQDTSLIETLYTTGEQMLNAINKHRNSSTHVDAFGATQFNRELFLSYCADVSALIESLRFISQYRLILAGSNDFDEDTEIYTYKAWELHGYSKDFVSINFKVSSRLSAGRVYLLKLDNQHQALIVLPLYPYLIGQVDPATKRPESLHGLKRIMRDKERLVWDSFKDEAVEKAAFETMLKHWRKNEVEQRPQNDRVVRSLRVSNSAFPKGAKLRVTASVIKNWFQYRCERKFLYESLGNQPNINLPVEVQLKQDSPMMQAGNEFEQCVLKDLMQSADALVIVPIQGEDSLRENVTAEFLKTIEAEQSVLYAYQPVLVSTSKLRDALKLPSRIEIGRSKPDLVQLTFEDIPVFRIIDIKASLKPTLFHRAQVAFYALVLENMLANNGIQARVADEGEIWFFTEEGQSDSYQVESFQLHPYKQVVLDFFHRRGGDFAGKQILDGFDDSFFHLYFKCEQCQYLSHCLKSIEGEKPSEWDISAVPGLTQESKRLLFNKSVRKLEDLAQFELTSGSTSTWTLRTKGREITKRAVNLLRNQVTRMTERHSWLMPPQTDVAIYLILDENALDGRLATLATRIVWQGRQPIDIIEVLTDATPKAETDALEKVLTEVVSTLDQVDRANQNGAQLKAHIFVYEPAESVDLQKALRRHLSSEVVRRTLLDMVRLFPPEGVLPEPEYKGYHYLPLTSLRQVISQIYALPLKVSYDLRHVSQSLKDHLTSHGMQVIPYVPQEGFQNVFSSRLNMQICQLLRQSGKAAETVEIDVVSRLDSLHSLRYWLEAENRVAEAAFLRLAKEPFRFQQSFDPIQPSDLDILRAHQILESKTAQLARLIELSYPTPMRIERFQCMGSLKLLEEQEAPNKGKRLTFEVPERSRQADIGTNSFGVILTNDDPDIRLDPRFWSAFEVQIVRRDSDRITLDIRANVFKAAAFQEVWKQNMFDNWYLDLIFLDPNTPKLVEYLKFLAREAVV